ncbi:MAG TPA: 50S ribosomal protein L4 [Gemmatimonadales bacterium]|nr:50S ribosomal protein L4 [Gemmatimonadales bacterium]
MLEAAHYSAQAKRKGTYALPAEFDGVVHAAVLHDAVRAHMNNQRQGTAATKTRGLVSGGNQKPWRQKGTGRARQGSIRAPHWPGGGTVFGPVPRSYRTELPRKVRRLARRSALNARAQSGGLYVIEQLALEQPKTRLMAELLSKLEVGGRKVLLLTSDHRPDVYRSARNIPGTRVMRYVEASAYDLLWADVVVVEEAAVGGHAVAGSSVRAKRAEKAAKAPRASARAKASKPAKPAARKKPTRKKDK